MEECSRHSVPEIFVSQIATASLASDCQLYVDDAILYMSYDLNDAYHKLIFTSSKFGPPSTSPTFLGILYDTNHTEPLPST